MKTRKSDVGAGATLDVATNVGPITVTVDALDRGLAVHPGLDGKGWTLTHAPSGKKVAKFGARAKALAAMRALHRLTDWDRPWWEMNFATRKRALSIIARHGGTRDNPEVRP